MSTEKFIQKAFVISNPQAFQSKKLFNLTKFVQDVLIDLGFSSAYKCCGGAITINSIGYGLSSAAQDTQTGAYQIINQFNTFSVVTSTNNSAVLPVAKKHSVIYVFNADGADALKVYPTVGESTNGSANTAVSVAAGKNTVFVSDADGNWVSRQLN